MIDLRGPRRWTKPTEPSRIQTISRSVFATLKQFKEASTIPYKIRSGAQSFQQLLTKFKQAWTTHHQKIRAVYRAFNNRSQHLKSRFCALNKFKKACTLPLKIRRGLQSLQQPLLNFKDGFEGPHKIQRRLNLTKIRRGVPRPQ